MVFDVSKDEFDALVDTIKAENWFERARIKDAAVEFCNSVLEKQRYSPFCSMANAILEFAQDSPKLSALGASTFPINDGVWIVNDPLIISRHPRHAKYGAVRIPDIAYLRQKDLDAEGTDAKRRKVRTWSEFLAFVEVKEDDTEAKQKICPPRLIDQQEKDRDHSSKTPSAPVANAPNDPNAVCPSSEPSSRAASPQSTSLSSGSKRKQHDGKPSESSGSGSSAKRRRIAAPAGGVTQAAGYALEILSNTNGSRVHCLGFVLWRQQLSLWFYDASGIVTTSNSVRIIDDFETFAAIVVCVTRCTPEQFGATPKIYPHPNMPYPEHFPPRSMEGYTIGFTDVGVTIAVATPATIPDTNISTSSPTSKAPIQVTLGAPIFAQYALVGRHTVVYNATAENLPGRAPGTLLVVKISQQVKTRLREQDLLAIAREAGVNNLPDLHLAQDLWSLDDSSRGWSGSQERMNYESRVLRALVYTKYEPLGALFSTSSEFLGEMVYQMLDCLHDLRYKALILHRDISFNNIMVMLLGSGTPRFILNDFDLATRVTPTGEPAGGPTSRHRTGTLPFMALDILTGLFQEHELGQKPIDNSAYHRLRYDYESLLYVALWCCFTCEKTPQKAGLVDAQVACWERGTYRGMCNSKSSLLTKSSPKYLGGDSITSLFLTPKFEIWRPWFRAWISKVTAPALAKADLDDPDTDVETFGGLWTRDHICEVLRKKDPILAAKMRESA